jgi:hypothetical protein
MGFLSPVIPQKLIDVHLLVCNAVFGEIGREERLFTLFEKHLMSGER